MQAGRRRQKLPGEGVSADEVQSSGAGGREPVNWQAAVANGARDEGRAVLGGVGRSRGRSRSRGRKLRRRFAMDSWCAGGASGRGAAQMATGRRCHTSSHHRPHGRLRTRRRTRHLGSPCEGEPTPPSTPGTCRVHSNEGSGNQSLHFIPGPITLVSRRVDGEQ